MKILKDKREKFAQDFETIYLQRGFGSMNKNELEVLFFYLFKEYGDIGGKSVFELARELKLSESKVKRLQYESELIYSQQDREEMQNKFLGLVANAKILKEGETLRFVIEDRFLRSFIYEDLKQNGYYLDSSFNNEVISIQKEALVFLLDLYFKDEDKKEVVQSYRESRKIVKQAAQNISFYNVMTIIFDEILRNGVDATNEGLGKIDIRAFLSIVSKGVHSLGVICKIAACVAALF